MLKLVEQAVFFKCLEKGIRYKGRVSELFFSPELMLNLFAVLFGVLFVWFFLGGVFVYLFVWFGLVWFFSDFDGFHITLLDTGIALSV